MVPASPLLQAGGVAVVLRDSGAVAIFSQPSLQPVLDLLRAEFPHIAAARWILTGDGAGYSAYETLLASAPPLGETEPVDADAPFNIMYSSGTTGAPKGIVLTQRIRMAYALQF